MIGCTEDSSVVHATQAARARGWHTDMPDLLSLGSLRSGLHSVGQLGDMSLVVQLGSPMQPRPELELALLEAPARVFVNDVVCAPNDWAVYTQTNRPDFVVVDANAYAVSKQELEKLGIPLRVVPAEETMAARVQMCGSGGAIATEPRQAPKGWRLLSETARWEKPTWYGLARYVSGEGIWPDRGIAWMAFEPKDDHRGSLGEALDAFVESNFNLQHLRSLEVRPGKHVFFCAFDCSREVHLNELKDRFRALGTKFRLLAVIPLDDAQGAHAVPTQAVSAVWEH